MKKFRLLCPVILILIFSIVLILPASAADNDTTSETTNNQWDILVLIHRCVNTDIYSNSFSNSDINATKQTLNAFPSTINRLSNGRIQIRNLDVSVIDTPVTNVSSLYGYAGYLSFGPNEDINLDPYLQEMQYNQIIIISPIGNYPDGNNTGWFGLGGVYYTYQSKPVYIVQINSSLISKTGTVYGQSYNLGTAALVHETLHSVETNASYFRGYTGFEGVHNAELNGYTNQNEWMDWYHDLMRDCLKTGKKGFSPESFLVDHIPSTLNISMTNPGTIQKGSLETFTGTVKSNYRLKSITVTLLNNNTTVASDVFHPTTYKSANLNVGMIGQFIKDSINAQNPGTYTLRVSAEDCSGKTASKQISFQISNSTLTISMTNPGTVLWGSLETFQGTVQSNYNFRSITVTLLKSNATVASEVFHPTTYKSANLNVGMIGQFIKDSINAQNAGTYTLRVSAEDCAEGTASKQITFKINKPSSTLTITMTNPGTVPQGAMSTFTGTVKSNYKFRSITVTLLSNNNSISSEIFYPTTYNSANLNVGMIGQFIKDAVNAQGKGTFTLRVAAEDITGKTVSKQITFRIV